MNTKSYKHGQQILTEGEVNSGVFIINSGKILLSKVKGSDLVEIDELTKGDYLGLSSYFDKKNENTTATASGNVSLTEVSTDILKNLRIDRERNVILNMLQFLSGRLHMQNEKIKRLQYFNKLYFDRYKKEEMSLYHMKDILKMSWILLLSFNRYNYSIAKDMFEDLCAIMISDFKTKPEKIIQLYVSGQIIVEDTKTGNISLINADKLEFFCHFLLENFIKNPRRLLLNKPTLQLLEHLVSMKDQKKLFQEDEFGFHLTFRQDLVRACEAFPNANLIIERLTDRGFFKREFDTSGQTILSFEFSVIEEILRCYEIIHNFEL